MKSKIFLTAIMFTGFVFYFISCIILLHDPLLFDWVDINAILSSQDIMLGLAFITLSCVMVSIAWFSRRRVLYPLVFGSALYSTYYVSEQIQTLFNKTWSALETICAHDIPSNATLTSHNQIPRVPLTPDLSNSTCFKLGYVLDPSQPQYHLAYLSGTLPSYMMISAFAFYAFLISAIVLLILARSKYPLLKSLYITFTVTSILILFLIISGAYLAFPPDIFMPNPVIGFTYPGPWTVIDPNGMLNMHVTNFIGFITNGEVLVATSILLVWSSFGLARNRTNLKPN